MINPSIIPKSLNLRHIKNFKLIYLTKSHLIIKSLSIFLHKLTFETLMKFNNSLFIHTLKYTLNHSRWIYHQEHNFSKKIIHLFIKRNTILS